MLILTTTIGSSLPCSCLFLLTLFHSLSSAQHPSSIMLYLPSFTAHPSSFQKHFSFPPPMSVPQVHLLSLTFPWLPAGFPCPHFLSPSICLHQSQSVCFTVSYSFFVMPSGRSISISWSVQFPVTPCTQASNDSIFSSLILLSASLHTVKQIFCFSIIWQKPQKCSDRVVHGNPAISSAHRHRADGCSRWGESFIDLESGIPLSILKMMFEHCAKSSRTGNTSDLRESSPK